MPIESGYVKPKEAEFAPLPPDTYTVEIMDLEFQVKPSPFTKEDGSPQEDTRQYQVTFKVADEGEVNGRMLKAWINETLRVSTKAKNPTLVEFLKAVTGEDFGVNDNDKLTGDFLNSFIGSMIRVSTKIAESKSGAKNTKVVSFLPLRRS